MEKLTLKMCRFLIECIGITLKWVEDVIEERDGYKERAETQEGVDKMLAGNKKANPSKFRSHKGKEGK